MQNAPIFAGRVEKGKLQIRNVKAFTDWLGCLKGDVQIIVKKKRKDRTLLQNAYYWVCITIIANELGYLPEEIHATFKAMFLVDRSGKMPVVRSTTRLNTVEFSEYFERIALQAAELGIVLPDPEDYK